MAVLGLALAGCQGLAPVAPTAPAAPPGQGTTAPTQAPAAARGAPDSASVAQAARYEREDGRLASAVTDADWLAAWPAWMASCRFLASEHNPHRAAWEPACTESIFLVPRRGTDVRDFFVRTMDRYRVWAVDAAAPAAGADAAVPAPMPAATGASAAGAQDAGLMTGYYEPILEGSRVRSGAFDVPLYRAPAQTVTQSRAALAASGQLQGLELLWVRDPVDAFFLEVQGSGRIHLGDGTWVRVAYAASNGQPYRSIGRWLIDQGELAPGKVSAPAIRDWAQAHPQRVRELLEQNPRVVFFREVALGDPDQGPVGSLGVPLTAGISVAVDPRYLPLGAPLLIDTSAPKGDTALARLALAQDTGGAIIGPLRVDWFWGTGPDAAEWAGHQHAPGTVRLLVPRGVDPRSLLAPSG